MKVLPSGLSTEITLSVCVTPCDSPFLPQPLSGCSLIFMRACRFSDKLKIVRRSNESDVVNRSRRCRDISWKFDPFPRCSMTLHETRGFYGINIVVCSSLLLLSLNRMNWYLREQIFKVLWYYIYKSRGNKWNLLSDYICKLNSVVTSIFASNLPFSLVTILSQLLCNSEGLHAVPTQWKASCVCNEVQFRL